MRACVMTRSARAGGGACPTAREASTSVESAPSARRVLAIIYSGGWSGDAGPDENGAACGIGARRGVFRGECSRSGVELDSFDVARQHVVDAESLNEGAVHPVLR